MSSLHEITTLYKQSEQKRIHFEARMQTQWDVFVKKMMLMQGQKNERAEATDDSDDYDDLDENFPINVLSHVEDLEWSIQKNLELKRRMVIHHSIFT